MGFKFLGLIKTWIYWYELPCLFSLKRAYAIFVIIISVNKIGDLICPATWCGSQYKITEK